MIDSDLILTTERTRMRPPRTADYDDVCALWGDPRVTEFVTGDPQDFEASWSRLLRLMGHWAALGYGPWIIEDRETGGFIGEAGFRDYRRNTTPSFLGTPEIGYVIRPDRQGRGFAGETVRAALDWADATFKDPRTVCMIAEENAPSILVAERVGYTEFARTLYKGKPVLCLERYRKADP